MLFLSMQRKNCLLPFFFFNEKKKYYRSGEVDWSEKIRNKEPLALQTRGSEFRSLARMEKLNETRTYCPGAGQGKGEGLRDCWSC